MNPNSPFILFADRDLSWSRALRVSLRRRGARVLSATKAHELLDLACRVSPELIVLDGGLDDVGAGLLLQLVRHRSPRSSIVLLTQEPMRSPLEFHQSLPMVYNGPWLPDADEVGRAINGWLTERLSEEEAVSSESPLILCVDDDLFFLKSLSRILNRRGYRVASFTDPARALQEMGARPPDMAIVDVMMPGMSGLELTDRIRDGYGLRVPVVLLTARAADDDVVSGYRRGATYYITKPCEPEAVLNIVDYLVGDLDERERHLLETQL